MEPAEQTSEGSHPTTTNPPVDVGASPFALDDLLTSNRTAVFWHPACALHDIPNHPEQPGRIQSILSALRSELDGLVFREATLAPIAVTKLFHTETMVSRFTKHWQTTEDAFNSKKKVIYKSLDGGDTQIMYTTREAALRAVGAVINAIDHMHLPAAHLDSIDSAFCCIRPPGHHAEPARACGFCFFNNIAIGAKYLLQHAPRVAVLDFDVHHGNGTEEGFKEDERLFYGSTHEKDNFPGTGKDPSPLVGERSTDALHRRIVNRYLHSGSASREEFLLKWMQVLEEMERFAPDAILLSAGFDAHDDDPLSDIELQDEDYTWLTKQVMLSALKLSVVKQKRVKVMSVLEGGYDLDAIARSSVCHVRVLQEGFQGIAEDYHAYQRTVTEQKVRGAEAKEDEEDEEGYGGDEVAALRAHMEAMGIFDPVSAAAPSAGNV